MINEARFESLAPKSEDVDALWHSFWEHADRRGAHYIWGRESFLYSGYDARTLAWMYVWAPKKPLHEGEELRPICGEPRCIRPEHQEVVRREAA